MGRDDAPLLPHGRKGKYSPNSVQLQYSRIGLLPLPRPFRENSLSKAQCLLSCCNTVREATTQSSACSRPEAEHGHCIASGEQHRARNTLNASTASASGNIFSKHDAHLETQREKGRGNGTMPRTSAASHRLCPHLWPLSRAHDHMTIALHGTPPTNRRIDANDAKACASATLLTTGVLWFVEKQLHHAHALCRSMCCSFLFFVSLHHLSLAP